MAHPRIEPNQLNKYFIAPVGISNFNYENGFGDTTVIDAQVATVLASAGENHTAAGVLTNVAVPNRIAYSTGNANEMDGIITDTSLTRTDVRETLTGNPLTFDDGAGNVYEVYGIIGESLGSIELRLFYTNNAGLVSPYTPPTDTNIDFEIFYNFKIQDLPANAMNVVRNRVVQDDPKTQAQKTTHEDLTLTAVNTISALSSTPVPGTRVLLHVNGQTFVEGSTFTRAGTTLTWTATAATVGGYDLVPGLFDVAVSYEIF